MSHKIHKWTDISAHYTDTLIIGNGASINLDEGFRYSSLKEYAVGNNLLSDDINKLFDFFKTSDFEMILRLVWQANNVNAALGINDGKTKEAYERVRDSLIKTIQQIHPLYQDIENHLLTLEDFVKSFKTVFSLNYDLILYWMLMLSNASDKKHCFKDCIISNYFDPEWKKYREPKGSLQESVTLVFYPHGNLLLARNAQEQEVKLKASLNVDLLSSILAVWQEGEHVPLFVSEGDSAQKLAAINSSHYLSTVYREALSEDKKNIVIYGWGIDERDVHILKAVAKSKPHRVAVSVFNNDQDYCDRVSKILREYMDKDIDIEFFDSKSENCWNNVKSDDITA